MPYVHFNDTSFITAHARTANGFAFLMPNITEGGVFPAGLAGASSLEGPQFGASLLAAERSAQTTIHCL
jgi:hypothetical protein